MAETQHGAREAHAAEAAPCQFGATCPRPAYQTCMCCNAPTCVEHSHPLEGGRIICVTCITRLE